MAKYFEHVNRTWVEIAPRVFASDLHRYPSGGGAALFRLESGARMAEHAHPTGEHGYIISGVGEFGGRTLKAGDAFWMDIGDSHDVYAVTELVFLATSLPGAEVE